MSDPARYPFDQRSRWSPFSSIRPTSMSPPTSRVDSVTFLAQTRLQKPVPNSPLHTTTGDQSVSFYPSSKPLEAISAHVRLRTKVDEPLAAALFRQACPDQYEKCNEILQTSFPRNLDPPPDVIPQRNGFVHTAIEAYNNHRALIIRPDDVWHAILFQFSLFVNANAEALRGAFVRHSGQEEVVVQAIGNRYAVDFTFIVTQMTALMQERITDPVLREWVLPRFTTTTKVDTAVFSMAMMSSMKEYFTYRVILRCGLPVVTLQGQKSDWQDILTRIEKLKEYGPKTTAWFYLLRPILMKFVASFDQPDSQQNMDFWNKIAHFQSGGSGPTWLSGWITAFCVFNERGQWMGPRLLNSDVRSSHSHPSLRPTADAASIFAPPDKTTTLTLDGIPYPRIDSASIPCGYAYIDVRLEDNGEEFDTAIVAGQVGSLISSSGRPGPRTSGRRDTMQPYTAWWHFVKNPLP